MYDIAIIGSGPAGISAALNLKLHNKSIIWFGTRSLSDKVERSEKIANYPGFTKISGPKLNAEMLSQIDEMGLELTEKMVTGITPRKNGYMLLGGNDIYEAKAVLLATGAVSAKGFDGENQFLGKGVSYCATCDGFLYKGRTIAVFCGSKSFEHEVEYLADVAEKVYLFTAYSSSQIDLPNVIRLEKAIKSVCGENKVNKIVLSDKTEVLVDGVFILRNSVSPSVLLNGLEIDGASIIVNRKMETNKKGCYAAGDCTGRPYQIAKATGEGNVAAHSIMQYLAEMQE